MQYMHMKTLSMNHTQYLLILILLLPRSRQFKHRYILTMDENYTVLIYSSDDKSIFQDVQLINPV